MYTCRGRYDSPDPRRLFDPPRGLVRSHSAPDLVSYLTWDHQPPPGAGPPPAVGPSPPAGASTPAAGLRATSRLPRSASFPSKESAAREKDLEDMLKGLSGAVGGAAATGELHYAFGGSITSEDRSAGLPPSVIGPLWDWLCADGLVCAGTLNGEFNRYRNFHIHLILFIPVTRWDGASVDTFIPLTS